MVGFFMESELYKTYVMEFTRNNKTKGKLMIYHE